MSLSLQGFKPPSGNLGMYYFFLYHYFETLALFLALDGDLNPCKDKDKKNQEKTKCTYYHKGWHPYSACMKNTIDMMVQLLEKNNIPLLEGARKKDGGSGLDNKERFHALVVGSFDSSSFIIDS